jgi:hypothetical protein
MTHASDSDAPGAFVREFGSDGASARLRVATSDRGVCRRGWLHDLRQALVRCATPVEIFESGEETLDDGCCEFRACHRDS